MRCFYFSNGNKKEEVEETDHSTKLASARSNSNSTASTDGDIRRSGSEFFNSQNVSEIRRSGSEFNSQNVSDISIESERMSQYPSFSQRPSNLRVFTFSELRVATKNFSHSLMIGEGGFGCVYRGTIRSSEEPNTKIDIAVKQLSRKGLQGHKQWLTEVNVLGIVEHPNLVKLVGYCAEDDERGIQRLLIYEYMPNRSVLDHLSPRCTTPLSWIMRLKIALDAARGLAYLHEGLEFQIIFRDFKTSNILLDEQWNAKLSDFGLARQGPEEGLTHVSTAVVGTIGYAAPEYMQTGHLTAKSDTWSYGVVLYELITGRPPIDRNRPRGEQKLLEWVRPYISDPKKFRIILDPRLDDRQAMKTAMKLSSIANKCLVGRPRLRPKMSEVLEMVQRVVENAEIGNPQSPLKIHVPQEAPQDQQEKKRGLNLKRRIINWRMGERRRLVWRGWTPKLV